MHPKLMLTRRSRSLRRSCSARRRRSRRRPRSNDPGVTSTLDPARRHRAAHRLLRRPTRQSRAAPTPTSSTSTPAAASTAARSSTRVVDDGTTRPRRCRSTHQLVEQDKVFAMFNSARHRQQPRRAAVPQHDEGAAAVRRRRARRRGARDYATYPYSIGFQPSYQAEGWVYGKYLARTRPGATIAVLFQNDDYGKDLLGGLKRGLAALEGEGDRGAALRRQGGRRLGADREAEGVGRRHARHLRDAELRGPGVLDANKLGWKPKRVSTTRSAPAPRRWCGASDDGQNKLVNGTLSIAFMKDPNDPQWKADASMKLYRKILNRYAPGATGDDVALRLRDGRRVDGRRGAAAGRQEPHPRVARQGARHVHRGREPVPAARHRGQDGGRAITSRSSRCSCSAGKARPGSRSAASGPTGRSSAGVCACRRRLRPLDYALTLRREETARRQPVTDGTPRLRDPQRVP